MKAPRTLVAVLLAPAILIGSTAFAQRGPRGQGAIVIRDDAPVYAHSDGDTVEHRMKKGDPVCGITSGLTPLYLFDEVKGRLHVMYFAGEQKGMNKTAWMDPKDLSRFTYDGSCQRTGSPFATKGFSLRWNACFEEARDNKLDALRLLWAQQDALAAKPIPAASPVPSPGATAAPPPEPTK
jgi:hypothetical protein